VSPTRVALNSSGLSRRLSPPSFTVPFLLLSGQEVASELPIFCFLPLEIIVAFPLLRRFLRVFPVRFSFFLAPQSRVSPPAHEVLSSCYRSLGGPSAVLLSRSPLSSPRLEWGGVTRVISPAHPRPPDAHDVPPPPLLRRPPHKIPPERSQPTRPYS